MLVYSNFKPWSIGIVVENKERDSSEIKAIPIELLPDMAEELTADTRTRTKSGVNYMGKLYGVSITEQAWLPAEWLGSTYFEKSPDLAVGEQVMLYKTGDGSKWYWDVFGRNDSHRMQEDVVISISAKPDYDKGEPVPKDETNSYRLRFNSYEKYIELSTSGANEEPVTYNLKWDLAEGTWTHVDSEGNFLFLDSVNTVWHMFNKDESFIKMDKKEIFISSQDLIQFDTKEWVTNCETFTVNCDSFTVNSKETSMNADTAQLNFGQCTVGSGSWVFNADVKFNKPVDINGPLKTAATIKFGTPIKLDIGKSISMGT